jgi:drug/metabolite transporter (DMT)-like permease
VPSAVSYAMMALAAFTFSTNFIVAKSIQTDVPPFTLATLRQIVSLLSLIPLAARSHRTNPTPLPKTTDCLILGALGIAAPHALIYLALHRTQAINVALVNAMLPVVVLAASYLVYRTRPIRVQIVGIALSAAGAFSILARGTPFALAELAFNLGDVLAFAAIVSVALYSVLLVRRGAAPVVPFLAGLTAASALLLAPAAVIESVYLARWTPSFDSVLGIVYVGLLPSTVGMLCWNLAIARLGAAAAGQAVHLIPVFTAMLAVPVLGEHLQPYHVLGFVLVGLGILVANRRAES